MEAIPDDILQHDLHTFPREDPVTSAKRAALDAKQEKEDKARAAAEAKARKAEEATVAKAVRSKPAAQQQAHDAKAERARQLTAHKIKLYFKLLGHKLSTKEPKTLPKDDEALAELLLTIETELHSAGGIASASTMFVTSGLVIEQLNARFDPFGLKLSGPVASLSGTIAANKAEWDELVTEFAIANCQLFMTGPTLRLVGFMGKMVQLVDNANRNGARAVSKEEREATEGL